MLKLPYGRSGLRTLVGEELLNKEQAGADVDSVWRRMRAYGVEESKERALRLERALSGGGEGPWLLHSNGGLRGTRGGIGVVVARGGEIKYAAGFGILVHAGHSTCMEWMGQGVMLRMARHLQGEKMLVADSAAAAFTWVDELVRGALEEEELTTYKECWVEAEHDSGSKELLALCNKVTDDKSTEALQVAREKDFFLPRDMVLLNA